MRRIRLLFLAFSLALLGPVALLVHRALQSVTLERQMRHQAVAERVFDEMERSLSRLLEREEERPFDEYAAGIEASALPFVLGHFQVDPDGTIRAFGAAAAAERAGARAEVERLVATYWRAARTVPSGQPATVSQLPGTTIEIGKDARQGVAVDESKRRDAPASAMGVSAFDALRSLNKGVLERAERQRKVLEYERPDEGARDRSRNALDAETAPAPREEMLGVADSEIELPPMVGRVVDGEHLLLYRTVLRENRGYRQGVLLDVQRLATWLREQGLGSDGLAAHAEASFATTLQPASGLAAESPFIYQHRFADPFDGLSARLVLQPLPGLGSVTYVYALCALLAATAGLGLAALYRMVSVTVSYAERRSNFVAAVSHELKTPLTAIRMYGEMLRDGMVASDVKRGEYYRHITAESERLSRLINNVLEFSRLEKGTRDVTLVAGAVAPVVHEVAELLRPHIEGEGFELRVVVEPALPPVRYDRDALMQVLWNLVDNAVKYARDASPKRIDLCCRSHDGGVAVTVRDHGAGVPARHVGRIFEPFYRGENELTRRSKGTGLGLALVRGLVERMGARVTGRNARGGGFEVEVAFRAAPPS